ncbi:MAG: glycoside hydrolase family 3 C-terminal domain-containing protein [Alphaproteobacteria bacterium]|nr:glycoside hydrolase family 3 C-terminal domain-containing protein [Alphaproteobacteria bacterium]
MKTLSPRKGMTEAEIAATVESILREATLEEKVEMMSGKGFFKQFSESGNRWGGNPYRAGGGCERLGVPALYFTDGPRGVARGNSTCFPCSMARGAAFDVDLERRIGEIFGIEARAQGCTLSGAVCMNLLRHPAWGRAQETYGEDPHHLGEMGAALAQGIQTHNVVATVKHYALNSMENARFKVDVIADERTLHEVYLPHFKRALDTGCATVMSAYNKLNGEYCGENRVLLTDILRGEWGFDGFVHSDWVFGVHKQYAAAAGLDVENPEPLVFGEKLVAAVQSGAVEPQAIDKACRRILTVIYRFAAAEDPLPAYTPDLVASERHRAVALEAAEKSAVLLTNDGALPQYKEKVKKLAILGRLAALENTGDFGSSRVRPPYVVTPLEGLKRYLGENAILTADEKDLAAARSAAKSADAVVVVVGYTAKEEGEFVPGDISLGQDGGQPDDNGPPQPIGGDRDSLELPPAQVDLIKAAAESGNPVIVVVIAGSAVIMEKWLTKANAILQTFYSGMEGGTALAKLLFGDVSPSGKLPFTVAKSAADYPFFDKNADRIDYGYYHGYTLFEREGRAPRFAFGHGLSYTTFAYRALKLRRAGDAVEVTVSVTNTGKRTADEIVQIYVGFPAKAADRPKRLLKSFARVHLAPGETKTIRRQIPLKDLTWRDPATHTWKLESGPHAFHVGGSSHTTLTATIDL